MKYLFLFILAGNLQAQVYKTAERGYSDKPSSVKEILPATPTKSQDGIGLCYGFTATALLEHHRCKELNLSCQNSEDQLSVLDVTSYEEKNRLHEAGDTYAILNNVKGSLKIARETCVPYSNIVYQTEEKGGWNLLIEKWKESRGLIKGSGNRDCVSCLADSIKSSLGNIQTPKDQLVSAFNQARSMEEFLYQSLIPRHCLEESRMAIIPPFVARSFPTSQRTPPTVESVMEKAESLLQAGLPVEMAICPNMFASGECVPDSGHSITLFGIKEVCNRSGHCKTMVKVRNSYGESWQRQHDNGWIELEALAKSSVALTQFNNLSWIEKPGFILPKKVPAKVVSPRESSSSAGIPLDFKNHRGLWRCPGNSFKDSYEAGCIPYKP